MKLELIKEKKDDVDIVKLVGSLDGNTAELVQNEVVQGIEAGTKLVLEMSECGYVSSAGLRILMITAKTLKSKGGKGALANLLEDVKDVIEMTGFGNILHAAASVDEAVEYVKGV
jgi:anti-anti-sigma factor